MTEPVQSTDLADLVLRLQAQGLRTPAPVAGRTGGAGPSDVGMVWVDGVALTLDTDQGRAATSPFELHPEDEGFGLYEDGRRRATVRSSPRPRFYDLETADGIPYWKIALLHLDSLASTVLQTCAYWGNDDQCAFCGIEVSLQAGKTIARKQPEQLAEVAVAAKELDGVVDATLTTGSTRAPDKGALYVGRCAAAVKEAAGLPVEVQFEPPDELDTINQVRDMGADTVGIHVETFDPAVLARIAPAKARTGIEGYFRAWERAVECFGPGQVTTYVILGMGEDPDLTVEGCRRAIDMGVYPFVVPLRPVAGSLLAAADPPEHAYVESVLKRVVPYLQERGLAATTAKAGCARCQACSSMAAFEQRLQIGRKDAVSALGA
ncbi:MAG TPA: MSMEG_0568 family radical SAM protein [Acidimicrobiales bacterium]|nr:MSMEG_0568 family radical SAM protein [Acidimicrobiales bacterium]